MNGAPPLRVLQVTPRYAPDRGGVETHVEQLSRALTALGVSVEVATTGSGPAHEARDGIEVRRFPVFAPGGNYHLSPALYRHVRAERGRFDLIHAHSYHSLTTAAAALGAGKTPLVVTPHYHGTGHSLLRRALHVPYRSVGRRLLDKAAAVIAVSHAERDLLLSLDSRLAGRCVLVPNGIEDRFLDASPPVEREPGLVVTVGRLEAYKRTDGILEALALLPPQYRLEIVGAGPEESRLREMAARPGLQGRVRFRANLSGDELRDAYQSASVFVSLSSREAFGLTLLEAAACGCPVVASDLPAHRELAAMANGIVLVPSIEASEVARAIAAQAGHSASVLEPDRLRWLGIAQSILDLYHRVVTENRPAMRP